MGLEMKSVVMVVGWMTMLVMGIKLWSFMWRHFVRTASGLDLFKGEWALITGASDGIGAAFARQLASKGLNVVIMARSIDKLKTVEEDCRKRGAEVIVIPFDFATASDETYSSVRNQLSDITVSVLVNNVGVNVDFPSDFTDTTVETADRIVRVNVHATVEMTRNFLAPMIERQKGCVLFVSSAGGTTSPSPKLAVYAGTKAFIDSFSTALNGELADKGITTHSLRAFFVVSSMSKIRRSSLTVPTADAWVTSALKVVGREAVSNCYWSHDIMGFLLNLVPLEIQITRVNALHKSIRERALKKKERERKAQ